MLEEFHNQKADLDFSVTSEYRHGVVHMREGLLVSANADILHGHGAVLSLLLTPTPTVDVSINREPIRKTISYTLPQLKQIISSIKPPAEYLSEEEEGKLLEDAKIAFFLFQFKKASQCLAKILKNNRFHYFAWLWQSRIISRQDNISLALDEACRWGSSNQEVWSEARKIRPQLKKSQEKVKRCCFCWSVLDNLNQCEHCKGFLTIPEGSPVHECAEDQIRYAVSLFDKALAQDSRYAQTAYFLALGHFNLKEYEQAVKFMTMATELSPRTKIYGKGNELLSAFMKQREASLPQHSPNGKPGRTVLLIEDSPTSRKVLSMMLVKQGFEVLEAATGDEALKICEQTPPNLLVLDVMLPDTTGHKLLAALHKKTAMQTIPVIMLTASLTANDKFLGSKFGVKDFVSKPFDPEKLLKIIKGYLPDQEVNNSNKPLLKKDEVAKQVTGKDTAGTQKPAVEKKKKSPDGKKTVFIVEDSPTSRKVLKMILGRNGFEVVEAGTGKEALAVAEDIYPDLVLLDLMLPDTTGYELFPVLKKMDGFVDTPFFILTGKRAPTDKMKGMLLGTNEYVTKPFNPEKLVGLIKRYIAN